VWYSKVKKRGESMTAGIFDGRNGWENLNDTCIPFREEIKESLLKDLSNKKIDALSTDAINKMVAKAIQDLDNKIKEEIASPTDKTQRKIRLFLNNSRVNINHYFIEKFYKPEQ
jgi:hypothetical protein